MSNILKKRNVYNFSTSHLIAKFEDFLQRPAVSVDHDGVCVAVDDFQIHLSHMRETKNRRKSNY